MAAATACQLSLAASGQRWYGGLLKPTFSPSPGLAAGTSLALAAALSWAFFRVLCRPDYLPDRPSAIRLFLLALGLDVAWCWLFFSGRHPTVALTAAAALAGLVPVAAWRFAAVDRRAGLLLIPWALAAGFAFLLDLSIALRNG